MTQESAEQLKKAEERERAILTVLEHIQLSLRASALMQVADELYTKNERTQRRQAYLQLQETHRQAQDRVRHAWPEDGLSREACVAKYGEEKALQLLAPYDAAVETNRGTFAALTAFEKEHKILLRLWQCHTDLSSGRLE